MLSVSQPTSTHWFLDPYILHVLRAQQNTEVTDLACILHPGSWCANLGVSYPSLYLSCAFDKPFYHSIMLVASRVNSGSHRHMPLLNLLAIKWVLWSDAMLYTKLCWWIKYSVSPQILMLLEAPWVGKTNTYLEYMSIPVRTNLWPIQNGRGLIQSTCHQSLLEEWCHIGGTAVSSVASIWDIWQHQQLKQSWPVGQVAQFPSLPLWLLLHQFIVLSLGQPVTEAD